MQPQLSMASRAGRGRGIRAGLLHPQLPLEVVGMRWCGTAGLPGASRRRSVMDSWRAGKSPRGMASLPLAPGGERQGITRNIRQAYRLTLSLHEATLWSLSILDDKICRWKPAFALCLSLPAPATYGGLKRLENGDRDGSCTKICHCWLTQSRQETRGLKTAHEKHASPLNLALDLKITHTVGHLCLAHWGLSFLQE